MTYVKEGKNHYHAMNGSNGCIPDSNEVYDTEEEAIGAICNTYGDSEGPYWAAHMATHLRTTGIVYFTHEAAKGADYAQVAECNDPECMEGEE